MNEPTETFANPAVPTDRYAEALRGAEPREALQKAPKRVKRLLKGLSEKQLRRKPAPDKWSIKEVIAHLADGEVVLSARLRFIAGQDRPPLPAYDQDSFVARLGVGKVKTKELLKQFSQARKLTLGLLERLERADWERVGIHAERGEVTIRSMVEHYAGHDRIHEQQIERVRRELSSKKRTKRHGREGALASSRKGRRVEHPAVVAGAPA